MASSAVPVVFDHPGAAFVLLRPGIKFPPIEKGWEKNGHSFQKAAAHAAKGGNVGAIAGNGHIGLDQDVPEAFKGLELPATTTWETRPGRLGMRFTCKDRSPEILARYGKKADLSQIKLFKDGKPIGEVKLDRAYQVIPPSWKEIDGQRVNYRILEEIPPAEISLEKLLSDLQAINITFSSKQESNTEKLEEIVKKSRQRRAESDEQRTRKYGEAALRDEVLALLDASEGNRNEQLNKSAFALGQLVSTRVLDEAEVIQGLTRAARATGLDPDEIERTIRSGLESGARHPREIPERAQKPVSNRNHGSGNSNDIKISDQEPATDGGNAQRLIRLHQNNIKYCHTFKKWMVWDGHRWKIDGDGSAYRFCDDVIKEIYSEATSSMDSKERQEWAKFAIRSDSGRGYRDMLFLASFNKKIAITSDSLDVNPWLLNTTNLTIDLKTFEARESRREDLITKTAGTNYDPTAKCSLWLKFLERTFGRDQELINYVQRAVGYSLTGSMVEQVYFFCHGTGANGKSVFLATLRALLGDLARQASFDTFLVQHTNKVRNDLAALVGARIITASEAEEGARLSMQVIKSWTGGDPITARFLFGEDFTFKPTGKIWLAANTKPVISERNYAAWRRVHLIPFLVTIPIDEQDRELENKLLDELPGVLVWALEGLKEYHKIGLQPPEAVKAATDAYRRENDSLAAFLAECCEVRRLAICKNSDLFREYLNFCGMDGYEPISQTKFSLELSGLEGIKKTRDRALGVIWHGIQLSKNWSDLVKANQHQAQGVKGVKANLQSFETSLHEANFSEMPSHPSQPSPDSDSKNRDPSQTAEEKAHGEPAEPGNPFERIRIASLMEYGYNGSVDPAKVASSLKLPLNEVTTWLEANYVRLDRPDGVIRYTQRRATA